MGRDQATRHGETEEFYFPLPTFDSRTDVATQAENTPFLASGVDGRFAGRLRRFPGYRLLTNLPATVGGNNVTYMGHTPLSLVFIKPFAIQKDVKQDAIFRGFMVLGRDATTSRDCLFAHYWNGSAWTTEKVLTLTGASGDYTAELDLAMDNRKLFIVGHYLDSGGTTKTRLNFIVRYDATASAWKSIPYACNIDSTPELTAPPWTNLNFTSATNIQDMTGAALFTDAMVNGILSVYVPSTTSSLAGNQRITARVDANNVTVSPGKSISGTALSAFVSQGRDASTSASQSSSTGGTRLVAPFTANGNLEIGTYVYTYRFVAPNENWFGPLHPFMSETFASPSGYIVIGINDSSGGNRLGWPFLRDLTQFFTKIKLQIFRSIKDGAAGATGGQSNLVYLEQEIEYEYDSTHKIWRQGTTDSIASESSDESVVAIGQKKAATVKGEDQTDGYNDNSLTAAGFVLDPDETTVLQGEYPLLKRVATFEELNVVVTRPMANDDSVDLDTVRWSSTVLSRPNMLPVNNRRPMPDFNSEVLTLANSAGFLAVVLTNDIVRISRSGQRLTFDNVHNRHGTLGRHSVVSVGNILFIASPIGVLTLELSSGELELIGATQDIFVSRWKSAITNANYQVHATYDAELGVVGFTLKPPSGSESEAETLYLWLNQGTMTLIEGTNFDAAVTTVVGGSGESALLRGVMFNATTRGLYVANSARVDPLTMCGGSASNDWNVQAATGSTTTGILVNTTTFALAADQGKDFFLVGITGANAGVARLISAVANGSPNDTITVAAFPTAPAAGDWFAIAPVPFRIWCWPVGVSPDGQVFEHFRMKKLTLTGAWFKGTGDLSANGWAKARVLLRDQDAVEISGTAANIPLTEDPSKSRGVTRANGGILVPCLECYAADQDLSLVAIEVDRTVEKTRVFSPQSVT